MNASATAKARNDECRIPNGNQHGLPATGVKVEGRKAFAEMAPEMVSFAKRLHRYPINGRRRSLREIASELAKAGYTDSKGKAFSAQSVKITCPGASHGVPTSRHRTMASPP